MNQNYNNHRRFYPLFHFFLIPLTTAGMIFSTVKLVGSPDYIHGMITLIFFLVLLTALIARMAALKAQDRAIRAEVSLRYFVLTGKMLPQDLRMGQIIALRFASDEECAALTDRTVSGNLKPGEIKKSIVSWKGDYHRV